MNLPPSQTAVDHLFQSYHETRAALDAHDLSLAVTFDNEYRKLLILSAASHLEALMSFHMFEYFAGLGEAPFEFVRRFALERRFFQWFDFTAPLPVAFFKQFGPSCKSAYEEAMEQNSHFESSCRSFISICATRNILVHQNLAVATFDQTPREIEQAYREAVQFPDLALRIVKRSA